MLRNDSIEWYKKQNHTLKKRNKRMVHEKTNVRT